MQQEFFCLDGQISFYQDESLQMPEVFASQMNLQEKFQYHHHDNLSTFHQTDQFHHEQLQDDMPNEDQAPIEQEQETKVKKQKKVRNSQNGFRQINRALRPYLKGKWNINKQDFFEKNKHLYTFAIFKKQCQKQRLQVMVQFLEKRFKQLLQDDSSTENKDIKLKKILIFFLSLSQQDFNKDKIGATLQNLGKAGQLKKHPINLTETQLVQIEAYFVPA